MKQLCVIFISILAIDFDILPQKRINIIEKFSYNWIQLTIYLLMTLLFFRFLIQFIMLNFREEEDEDESTRLPCS